MQLRSASSNSRGSGEEKHRSININGAQRRRSDEDDFLDGLPLYHCRSPAVRRDSSGSRLPEKWIHVIPVIVLLCIFFLWCFYFPVDVDVKDGRITALPNDTRIDLTILAVVATSPILLFPQNLSDEEEDETYFPLASSPN